MIRRTLAVLALLVAPASLEAQSPAPGWGDERALELVRRAQQKRTEAVADTALQNYRADARGRVYFYLDREDRGERNLVKTDQLALEVFWRAPRDVKQRIVGWRDQKSLPTNIRYHIDHLAVVMENFGDEIRIGDGDEVRDVPHPAAPGSESFYEYRLADSLTLRLPGAPEPVRVYQLEVRPRDPSRPGFVGSVFVERRAGDLVRMDFTFTPSSYRDPYLDYINISLDNGLWKGRFWLPNEQRVELRRRLPALDIPAGSVIRGTMRVGDYRFNEELPRSLFRGSPVVLAPERERENFAFEEEIFSELRDEGIGPAVELGEIRREAASLLRRQALERTRSTALFLSGGSDLLRYNRAEGLALGAGVRLPPLGPLGLSFRGGWAFGPGHPWGEARSEARAGTVPLELSAYGNLPRDAGVWPVASGVVNTLSSIVAGTDYTDLYYASGARLGAGLALRPGWTLAPALRAERHASATLSADASLGGTFRAVQAVDDGTLWGAELALERAPRAEQARWWEGRATIGLGRLDADSLGTMTFARPAVEVRGGRRLPMGIDAEGALLAGAAFGEIPRQELFLLGGKGTLPGFAHRAFGGDRVALASVTASADLLHPWLRGRLLAAAGWAGVGGAGETALGRWGSSPTDAVRASVGVGVGLFYGLVHLDLARGMGEGGEWQLMVETRREFWDFL